MASRTVSYVKAHFAEVIASVREGSEPLVVTQNGTSAVVIQDHAAFERTRQTLLLMRLVALGEREIEKKGGVSHESLFDGLRAGLQSKKRKRTK